mmetsp:Transcript_5904/g.14265  ORF Transcript_5904/g.14265 Transcript_5904/m.14265 type:complete len:278 (+) Transcript_5904:94-927(+)
MNQRSSIGLLCWQFVFLLVHSRILSQHGIILANTGPDFSPSSFSYRHTTVPKLDKEEIDLGTTLVAIKYKHGVVVGADTRTSVSGYVSNKFAYKINPILEGSKQSCVLCRSGSAADTQWLAKHAKNQFLKRSLEGYRPSVQEVAHYLRYQMRHSQSDYQASLICAGFDESGGRIFGITPGGSLWEESKFCVSGSGSTILLGYLDDAQENFEHLTKKDAIQLVTKLLRLSIGRDGSSGGLVRLYVIDKSGLEERTVYPSDGESKESYTELEGFATPSE